MASGGGGGGGGGAANLCSLGLGSGAGGGGMRSVGRLSLSIFVPSPRVGFKMEDS